MQRMERPEIEMFIRGSWSADTASPSCVASWSALNPSLGQCAVTALLVQDLWGGQLIRTVVAGQGSHYYNRLPDGQEIDLTRNQFPPGTVIPPGEPVDRAYVLDSEGAVRARTAERYRVLKARFELMMYSQNCGR